MMTVDITWCGTWGKFSCNTMSFHVGQRFANFTVNDTSGITSSQKKCVLFTLFMRLHLIDISSLREKNTVTNITPPSMF